MEIKLLMVAFSLRNPYKDYGQFFVQLRGSAINRWHYIEQVCVVTTYLDENTLAQTLSPLIEPTDSLLIGRLFSYSMNGWLPRESWSALWAMGNDAFKSQFPLLPPVPPPTPHKK